VSESCEVGCADGTTVIVENLFGNVPARRKFLKRDATEAAAVSAMVEKIAMSRPDVSIRLVIDGNEKFATAGDGDLKNTLYALLGRDFALRLLPVLAETCGIKVSGFVGRSDNARGNRNAQNLFINGRFVKSKTVTAALERAYASYLAPEKFPVAALFLECNPLLVDVNVHPAKLEVRFSNEQAIFEAVYYAVREAIASDHSRPALSLEKKHQTTYRVETTPIGTELPRYAVPSAPATTKAGNTASVRPNAPTFSKPSHASAFAPHPAAQMPLRETAAPRESMRVISEIREAITKSTAATPAPSAPLPTAPIAERTWRYIGEMFHTYLLVEDGDSVLLIDQHAAHERILFEELLSKMKADGRVLSQQLLLPLTVRLPEVEYAAVVDAKGDVEAIGFAFSETGLRGELSLEAVPDALEIAAAEELFTRLAAELAEGISTPGMTAELRRERALYQIACKAAIKGGRDYGIEQEEELVRQLLAHGDVTVCPHGRPVAFRLTLAELNHRFERT
jgi:DNA mismatch repair protein MutL